MDKIKLEKTARNQGKTYSNLKFQREELFKKWIQTNAELKIIWREIQIIDDEIGTDE